MFNHCVVGPISVQNQKIGQSRSFDENMRSQTSKTKFGATICFLEGWKHTPFNQILIYFSKSNIGIKKFWGTWREKRWKYNASTLDTCYFLFSNGGELKIQPKYFSPDNIVRKVHYFNSFDYVVHTNCKVARTY